MNWNTITLRQAQDIDRLRKSLKEEEALDAETKLLAIVLGKSQSEIDSMPWGEYVEARKVLDFMDNPVSGKASKYIDVNGRRYRCVYDITQMPFARYIEGKAFSKDFFQNMHKIAASMVIPQKRRFWYWLDLPYDASKHEEYSKDMLDAPFMTIYNSSVFFYHLFRNWTRVSKDFMIQELTKKGMSQPEAEELVIDLCSSLDGSIQLNK